MRPASLGFFLLMPSFAFCETHTYECESVPLRSGWTVWTSFCEPSEWVAGQQFLQHVGICPDSDPRTGQTSGYTTSIADFEGTAEFWIEWKVQSTGDSDELIFGGPCSLGVGNSGINYSIYMADDQVRFIRDVGLFDVLYFDTQAGVPHTYRLEVFTDALYLFYIDGVVVDSGLPEQHPVPFLNSNTVVNFRSKAVSVESTTTWSFFRWGQLQNPGGGDFTGGGEVDSADLPFFSECLNSPSGAWAGCVWADMDLSGGVDCADTALFTDAWTGEDDPPAFPECGQVLCPADLDGSDTVDAADLALLLGAWGPNAGHAADFNADGMVNAADLGPLLGAWGPCSK